MAIIRSSSAELIAFFETGDIPTADNFNDFIRSTSVYDGSLPIISGSAVSTGSFGAVHTSYISSSGIVTGLSASFSYLGPNVSVQNLTSMGHVLPSIDDTYNLGSSTKEWKDLHVDGTANLDIVDIDGAVDMASTLQVDGALTVSVSNTGADVIFHSATANEGVHYDASEDELGLLLTTKLKFHDIGGGEEIFASANGHLEINSGTTIDMTATTIQLNGAADINGDADVSGTLTAGTLTMTNISTGNITTTGNSVLGNADGDTHAITGTVALGGTSTVATDKKIQFRDTAIHISSPADGDLAIAADDEIDITSTLIDINGNLDISGTTLATGVLTSTAIQVVNGGLALATDKKIQFRDSAVYINSDADGYLESVADTGISFKIGSTEQVMLTDGVVAPTTNNDVDLGTSDLQWKNLYIDGIAEIDVLKGISKVDSDLIPNADDTYDLGSSGLEWKDLFIDGTANLDNAVIGTLTLTSISSDFDPTATNTYALGSTSKRFSELYTQTINASGISTLTGGVVYGTETKAVGALTPAIPVTFITIDGTKAYALADGATAGTIKHISVKTIANTPAGTLTPNATAGAWSTAAFSVVGQTLTLLWDGAGWSIIGRESGAAAATGVVAELPIIA
mgnify:CR=1 FL=1